VSSFTSGTTLQAGWANATIDHAAETIAVSRLWKKAIWTCSLYVGSTT
jgi:hypothetical protein